MPWPAHIGLWVTMLHMIIGPGLEDKFNSTI